MACGGSLANPWLHWSGGLRRSRPKRPRLATTLTSTQTRSNPGSTWRQASSCRASTATSLQNSSGSPWKILIHFTTRTRGWALLCVCVCVLLFWQTALAVPLIGRARHHFGRLSATRAERLHHFRSLLGTEIGLVSFDLQSRSGCCPLTVCLWRDGKKKKRTWQSFSESLCFGMWYTAGWEDYPKIENK